MFVISVEEGTKLEMMFRMVWLKNFTCELGFGILLRWKSY